MIQRTVRAKRHKINNLIRYLQDHSGKCQQPLTPYFSYSIIKLSNLM